MTKANKKLMAEFQRAADEVSMVRCPECGNEQADMGQGVECEECGFGPMPAKARPRE